MCTSEASDRPVKSGIQRPARQTARGAAVPEARCAAVPDNLSKRRECVAVPANLSGTEAHSRRLLSSVLPLWGLCGVLKIPHWGIGNGARSRRNPLCAGALVSAFFICVGQERPVGVPCWSHQVGPNREDAPHNVAP